MPRLENLIHRAHYAIHATRRVTQRVVGGMGVQQAIRTEARHFAQHLDASKRRNAAYQMSEAARELYGEYGGWKHGDPKEPRPAHLAADGKNFRLGTVPISTGALPGVLPGCTCSIVAPYEGGEVIT
jgi:hypothetical protein